MANRYRNKDIRIRVTETEKEMIKRKSLAAGFESINSYAHKMLLSGLVVKVDLKELLELNNEINKIGVNINQIAYKANFSNRVTLDDISKVEKLLKEVQSVQFEMLKKLSFKI